MFSVQMEQLTAEGLKVVNDLAQRYGFSQDAVIHMMYAMLKGRGGMAQFSHPEFAGSGQWMKGGMMMLGDMFNNALKARVDGLCQAISDVLTTQSELFPLGSFQSQSQSGSGHQQQIHGGGQQMSFSGHAGGPSLFSPDPRDTWWPPELGTPNATGAQNNVRYAYFSDSGRVAVDVNGKVDVYETGDHQIGGFSQQQGSGGVVFSTPSGSVSLTSLSTMSAGSQQALSSGTASQQQSSVAGQQAFQPMQPMQPLQPMQPFQPMQPIQPSPTWWPAELGTPNASGSQDEVRYAYFSEAGRLAVDLNGTINLYDVQDQPITGLAQGSSKGDPVFVTPEGLLSLSSLRPVAATPDRPGGTAVSGEADVLSALERLGELKRKGILTDEEFTAKKTELLSRL